MEDTAHYDTQTILKQYKVSTLYSTFEFADLFIFCNASKFQCVISVQPDSEDGHFYLGCYYDRLKSVLASDRLTKSAYVLLCLFLVVSK